MFLERIEKQRSDATKSSQQVGSGKNGVSLAERRVEAQLIYKNLRLEQKVSHDEAITALKKANYPTDGIEPVSR